MKIFIVIIILSLLMSNNSLFPQDTSSPTQESKGSLPSEVEEEEEKEEVSILQVKRLEREPSLYNMELREVELVDLFRLLAHDYDLNILLDKGVKGKVTASLTNISLEEALERITEMHNLRLEKKGNVIIVKPNLVTKVFILQHIEASSLLKREDRQAQATQTEAEGEGGGAQEDSEEEKPATIYDLLSGEGKVLLGKQPNSVMVIDYPQNLEKIEEYLKVIDKSVTAIDKGLTMRIFKLKYINAKELVGEGSISATTMGTTSPEGG
jgi:type II secretory pathway component HofQ